MGSIPESNVKGAVNKYDQYLSSARDFQGGPYQIKTRYILCTSPRVGLTVLGQMLTDTGCAGDPLEYFNPRYFQALQKRMNGGTTLSSVMSFLENHRTSSNGLFGVQIHWSHFNRLFQGNTDLRDEFFDCYDKIVFVRRRNRIEQAISLYRATRSNLWSSLDEGREGARHHDENTFDPVNIIRFLHNVSLQDQGWLDYFKRRQKEYLTVYYEDLMKDWNGKSQEVIDYLAPPYALPIPRKALRQQRPEEDALASELMNYLGCHVSS